MYWADLNEFDFINRFETLLSAASEIAFIDICEHGQYGEEHFTFSYQLLTVIIGKATNPEKRVSVELDQN